MNNEFFASISIFVILVLNAPGSQSFPNGAPNNLRVCKSLLPHHGAVNPQKSPSPFYIVSNTNNVVHGSKTIIKLCARSGTAYKGFVIQARSKSREGHSKALGTFAIVDPVHSKVIDCFNLTGSTVTHSSPDEKNTTSFLWTPPAKFIGVVVFHASVVQDFLTFWVNISTKVDVGFEREDETSHRYQGQLIGSSYVSDYHDSEVSLLNTTLYGECGRTKACFGIPDECVTTKTCDALVTVMARESKHEFEMLGSRYVAVSISENGNLNLDSVTECMLVSGAIVKLFRRRYEPSSGHTRSAVSSDLQLLNSSYFDGMVYCKFTRNEEVVLNGVHYNFKNKKYFILLGNEHYNTEENVRDIDLNNVKFHSSEQKNYLSNVTGFRLSREHMNSLKWYYEIERMILGFTFGIFYYVFNFAREYME